ncbi:MAG: ABC transporter substrate-binding protein [Acidiferrobacterales bacterium]|nr:ABC transporter substrate-binding protein [Acidiferrobacterales bacterium]
MKTITTNTFSNIVNLFSSVWVAMFAIVLLSSSAAHAMESPETVVKRTVDTIVKNIQSNRATYKADTNALYAMVEETLVPAIHVERMSNLILGNSAKTASASQRSAFASEFKTFLIRSYATALLDYTGNQKVNYFPVNMQPGADKVTVKGELVATDGKKYPISLYMSNRSDTSWRAYNMVVAGINFVSTYRANFGGVIAQKGVDGLIADLKTKNAKLAN